MEKYQSIIGFVEDQISSGKMLPKSKLPSVRKLAEYFQCSAGTVIKAYTELLNKHVIYNIPQSGYYVMTSELSANYNKTDEIIDFATAAPAINTLPYQDIHHCLNNAIDIHRQTLFTYGDAQGLPSLIYLISKQLQDYQIFTKPENIIICTGSQQAINILCQLSFPNGKKHSY